MATYQLHLQMFQFSRVEDVRRIIGKEEILILKTTVINNSNYTWCTGIKFGGPSVNNILCVLFWISVEWCTVLHN